MELLGAAVRPSISALKFLGNTVIWNARANLWLLDQIGSRMLASKYDKQMPKKHARKELDQAFSGAIYAAEKIDSAETNADKKDAEKLAAHEHRRSYAAIRQSLDYKVCDPDEAGRMLIELCKSMSDHKSLSVDLSEDMVSFIRQLPDAVLAVDQADDLR